jgi:hypothetical protein
MVRSRLSRSIALAVVAVSSVAWSADPPEVEKQVPAGNNRLINLKANAAKFVWRGGGENNRWGTFANWLQDGEDATRAPGAQDTVELTDRPTVADVATVSSIQGPAKKAVTLELMTDLRVTNSFRAHDLVLTSTADVRCTLTLGSDAMCEVGNSLQVDGADITFGTADARARPSAAIKLNKNGADKSASRLSNGTITNHGDLTLDGGDLGPGKADGAVVNAAGGKIHVRNTGFTYSGRLTNLGRIDFNAPDVTVTPRLVTLGVTRVITGAVDFGSPVLQLAGRFEPRGDEVRVKVSGGTNTLRVVGGTLAGAGTLDAHVALGVGSPAGVPFFRPTLSPGLVVPDPEGKPEVAVGTIAVTKDLSILSPVATVRLEVNGDKSMDTVTVGGATTLRGNATVTASTDYKPVAGTQHPLISATGGLSGTFGRVAIVRDPPGWVGAEKQGRHHWAGLYNTTSFVTRVQTTTPEK